MRVVPAAHTAAWLAGDFTGSTRAIQRATIQVGSQYAKRVSAENTYTTMIFAQGNYPVELPNLKSIQWQRSTEADAASCTITLWNTEPLPLGTTPDLDGNLDLPGYYTFNRGRTSYAPAATRWGHASNSWQDLIVPDRTIKTFEGYGFDATVGPEQDSHMTQSGVWLIDEVDYSADGLIVVTCRDLARLLMDQIMFPPVVPMQSYPLKFETRHNVPGPLVPSSTTAFVAPTLSTDSGQAGGYVGANALISGHKPSDAFDGSDATYWLSIGNATPSSDYSYEWLEANVSGTVAAVRVRPWAGPYRMYVSVYAGGKWQGQTKIPYNPNSAVAAPNGANINYVASVTTIKDSISTVQLKVPIPSATKVRVTFTGLYDSNIGTYQYRAGVREMTVSTTVTTLVPSTQVCGNISDYSDIIKILLAYGGFWWSPEAAEQRIRRVGGTFISYVAPNSDPVLEYGRIWGDIMQAGVAPIPESPLGVEIWDKKPLMDGISYVRDIVGFMFYVDELGSAVFRFPNVVQIGNYTGDLATGAVYTAGTAGMVVIDEQQTLLSLTAKLSSRSVRERVFVANSAGNVGGLAQGHNPYPANLRRVGGWTDMHFETSAECQRMAELITLQQAFTYRTDTLTIPGYSRIQVDDQVRIVEATTSETYVHYVKSITSNWDAETGEWTYALETHWLGGAPDTEWVFYQADLSAQTRAYLSGLSR